MLQFHFLPSHLAPSQKAAPNFWCCSLLWGGGGNRSMKGRTWGRREKFPAGIVTLSPPLPTYALQSNSPLIYFFRPFFKNYDYCFMTAKRYKSEPAKKEMLPWSLKGVSATLRVVLSLWSPGRPFLLLAGTCDNTQSIANQGGSSRLQYLTFFIGVSFCRCDWLNHWPCGGIQHAAPSLLGRSGLYPLGHL